MIQYLKNCSSDRKKEMEKYINQIQTKLFSVKKVKPNFFEGR